jgi:hypothetical protein
MSVKHDVVKIDEDGDNNNNNKYELLKVPVNA